MARETNVSINPVLHYNDPEKAIVFLTEAFGFSEKAVHKGPDGKVAYVEMEFGGAPIGFGPTTEGGPFDLGPSVVYVALDGLDAHYDGAVAAGAEIVMEPTDQDYGSRDYAARDPEGNVWCFGTYHPGTSPT